jgi:hypothetical protein
MRLWIALLAASAATLPVAPDSDIRVSVRTLPHSRMNCHIAFDYVQKQLEDRTGAVGTQATGWAVQHQLLGEIGEPCEPPPETLAKQAEGHIIQTREGGRIAYMYGSKQNDPVAMYEMTFPLRYGTFGVKEEETVGELIAALSAGGYPPAQYELGDIYIQQVVPAQPEVGVPLIRKAAEAGYREAQFYLGILYNNGRGVQKDPKQALFWLRKASEAGDYNALLVAADMVASGEGVKKDTREALRMTRAAADAGDARAMLMMAAALLQSDKPEKVEEEVWFWMNRASNAGDPEITRLVESQRERLKELYRRPPPRPRPNWRPPVQECPVTTTCMTWVSTSDGSTSKSCVGGVNYWNCKN